MTKTPPSAEPAPAHPDVEIARRETPFARFLQIDTFAFRHRLHPGEWSALRSHDVLRRGEAVAIVLFDPDRDRVVLTEQFRLPALLPGISAWQLEAMAELIDSDEMPEAVAVRENREETELAIIGEPVRIQRYLPSSGGSNDSVVLFCGRVDSTLAGGGCTVCRKSTRTFASLSRPSPRSRRSSTPVRSRADTLDRAPAALAPLQPITAGLGTLVDGITYIPW